MYKDNAQQQLPSKARFEMKHPEIAFEDYNVAVKEMNLEGGVMELKSLKSETKTLPTHAYLDLQELGVIQVMMNI